MNGMLSRYTMPFYAALRIVAGLLFAIHGAQKLFGFPGGQGRVEVASLAGVAGVIEFVGGLMIAFGFFTSIAAFVCSGLMAVAYWMAHGPRGWNPLTNQGELAVLFCFLFLFMSAFGSGPLSVDSVIRRQPDDRTPPV